MEINVTSTTVTFAAFAPTSGTPLPALVWIPIAILIIVTGSIIVKRRKR